VAIATCEFCSCRRRGSCGSTEDLGAHGLKPWLEAARKRLHHNVLAIAFADKLARIAWSVLARGRAFEVRKINQAAPQAT